MGIPSTMKARILVGLQIVAAAVLVALWWDISSTPWHNDAYAFWSAWTDGSLYPERWQPVSEYVYSPAFAHAFWPLTQVGWPKAHMLWTALQVGALAWMLTPLGALAAIAIPVPRIDPYWGPVYASLYNGNPMILTAAAITAGVRWPAAWSYVLLTKVSAGVGVLYFVVRREWRRATIALGVTAAIALVSFAIAPSLWAEWINLLAGAATHAGSSEALAKEQFMPLPLAVRGSLGLGLVALAGWRGWAWLVPLGCFLALPDIHLGGYAVLAAVPAVWWRARRQQTRASQPDQG